MNICLIVIGKTDDKNIVQLVDTYKNRLKHYIKFDIEQIDDIKNVKNLSEQQQKEKEGEQILQKLSTTDFLVLLDENGKDYTSVAFANFLQQKMNAGTKRLVFIIGGPYGFSEKIYNRANQKVSLSAMTFSHQMVRIFFTEQLYRAFTILNNEPYHHQ